jgi:hypothetical protein
MNRATPSMGMAGMATITPTPRNIRFSDVNEVFPYEKSNNINENSLVARFAVPSVSAAESQTVYGSSCRELVNKYLIIPWDHFLDNGYCLNRLSVMVWLPSVASLSTVNCRVSKCQWKLIITIKNPDIFSLEYVDTLLAKFYKDADGKPLYPPTHTRNVAHKKAVSTLPKNDEGKVVFTQVIKLPFQVYFEPVPVGNYDGVQFKGLEHGSIKVLVAELVSFSYGDYLVSKKHAINKDVECDQISQCGFGTVSGAATVARSYLSYSLQGKKLPPRVYGNSNAVELVPDPNAPVPEIETIGSKSSKLKEAIRTPSDKQDADSDGNSTISTGSDSSDSDETSSSEESRRRRKKRKKDKRAKRSHRRNKKRIAEKVRATAASNSFVANIDYQGEFASNVTTGTSTIPTTRRTQATDTLDNDTGTTGTGNYITGTQFEESTGSTGVTGGPEFHSAVQYDDNVTLTMPFDN